jgi:ERCC4-type nuclease
MPIYISPTEHQLQELGFGVTSPLPEQSGVDVLVISKQSRLGFQRKSEPDFYASLLDGRLAKELLQIQSSPILTHAFLILEGAFNFTTDGQSQSQYTTVTKRQFRSIITSIQDTGIVVHFTQSPTDTIDLITGLSVYYAKARHSSLSRRPKETNPWGVSTSRHFASHLLQSFPSIGPELADRIYQTFARAPIAWTCTEAELRTVQGIGAKLARELIKALE